MYSELFYWSRARGRCSRHTLMIWFCFPLNALNALYHLLTFHKWLTWLWRWLPLRLSRRQSKSFQNGMIILLLLALFSFLLCKRTLCFGRLQLAFKVSYWSPQKKHRVYTVHFNYFLCEKQYMYKICIATVRREFKQLCILLLRQGQPQVTKAYVTQVTMLAWFKSLYGVKIKSKFRQQYSTKPTKNISKSEKAYPVCCAVFSMLLSASKRCWERFISQQLFHVHHRIMLMTR